MCILSCVLGCTSGAGVQEHFLVLFEICESTCESPLLSCLVWSVGVSVLARMCAEKGVCKCLCVYKFTYKCIF
jgi:hypothetical protein